MDIGKGYTNQGWIYCVLIAQVQDVTLGNVNNAD